MFSALSWTLIACSPLAQPSEARDIRVRQDSTRVVDAAPTEEPLAGFYLVEARDEQAAIDIAARIPDAAEAYITVRALLPLEGIPPRVPPVWTTAGA